MSAAAKCRKFRLFGEGAKCPRPDDLGEGPLKECEFCRGIGPERSACFFCKGSASVHVVMS